MRAGGCGEVMQKHIFFSDIGRHLHTLSFEMQLVILLQMQCIPLRWDVCPSWYVPLKSATSQTEVCQRHNGQRKCKHFKQTFSDCKPCDMI